jgi:hypothetical protein
MYSAMALPFWSRLRYFNRLAVYETVVEDAIFAVLEGFQLGRFG